MKKNNNKNIPKRKQQIQYEDTDGSNFNITDSPHQISHHRRKKNTKSIFEVSDEELKDVSLEKALIVEVSRKTCKVLINDKIEECVIGGQFISKNESLIATGDLALTQKVDDQHWVIRKLLPRKSRLSRPAAKGTKLSFVKEKVIAANIDIIGIIVSAAKPAFKPALVDRYLLTAIKNNVKVILVMNKVDLVEEIPPDIFEYEKLGIKIFLTVATENIGIEELKDCLKDQIVVFTGHSGVGKSSLLNALEPNLNLKTQDVGDGKHCWKHTTRKSTLFKLENNAIVIDTPGIRELGIWDIPPETLPYYFPEFNELATQCKFSNCSHDHEPGCAVKNAVDEDQLSALRYDSYLRVLYTLRDDDKNKIY